MENGGKRLGFHKNCVLSIHKPHKTCLLHSQTKFDKQQTFPLFSCLERQQTSMLTVNEIMHLVNITLATMLDIARTVI